MTSRIEELETRLATVIDSPQKIDILNDLAWYLRETDPQRAFKLSEEAYVLAHQGQFEAAAYKKGVAYSLAHLGYLNHYQANYDLALSQSLEAVSLFQDLNHLPGLPTPLSIIGITYLRLGNYSEALPYQLKALEIAEQVGDQAGQARALNGIGIIYVWSEDHEQALAYFAKSLQISRQIGNKVGEAIALTNLCMSYRDLGRYEESLEQGFKCLQICQEIDNSRRQTSALNNIGNTYIALGQNNEALIYFNKALTLLETLDDKYIQVATLLYTGRAYHKHNQLELAQSHLHRALRIAQESEQKGFQFECHRALVETYKDQGNFKRALAHYEQFHTIKEMVFNEKADNKLKNLEVLHRTETAKKELEIYQLKNVALEQEITERKRVEAERERLITELEAKNTELDHFTYTVSHDLKSPLISIQGFLRFLEQDMLAGDREQIKKDIAFIHDATDKMNLLLDDLLELSRVGRIVSPSQSVPLVELVQEIVDLASGQILSREVEVNISPDLPIVFGDRSRLFEMIQNLIDNAIKYMGDQPQPHIEIGVKETGGKAICYVRDNGIGIEPGYHDKIFGLFERLNTETKGTGIGLALVKRIIDLHGGEIWVKSAGKGQGSTFYFTLPEPEEVAIEE